MSTYCFTLVKSCGVPAYKTMRGGIRTSTSMEPQCTEQSDTFSPFLSAFSTKSRAARPSNDFCIWKACKISLAISFALNCLRYAKQCKTDRASTPVEEGFTFSVMLTLLLQKLWSRSLLNNFLLSEIR